MGRYNRGYGRGYRRNQMSLFALLIIILLAVATGYVGTKYVIYPYLLNGQTPNKIITDQESKNETSTNPISSLPGIIVDKQDIKEETNDSKDNKTEEATKTNVTKETDSQVKETGSDVKKTTTSSSTGGAYSLQYGNFTVKEGATNRVKELTAQGINAYVFENKGSYRVLGNTYDNKEKAKEAAQIVLKSAGDVFVIDMKTII